MKFPLRKSLAGLALGCLLLGWLSAGRLAPRLTAAAVEAGDVSWLHENVNAAPVNWAFQAVSLADNSLVDLEWNAGGGAYQLASDTYGYFGAGYNFGTANAYDVMAVYIAPVKVKVNFDIHFAGFTQTAGSDGVILSAARSDLARLLLEPTHIEADGQPRDIAMNDIVLNAGDRVYLRFNKNQSQAYDVGAGLTVKVTYTEIDPAGLPSPAVQAGYTTYSHVQSVERPFDWEFQKVLLADNSVSPMVWADGAWRADANSASGDYYGAFSSGYWAGTSHAYDVMAVYTAPARVKVSFDIHVGQLAAQSDGVAISAMRNALHHYLLEETLLTPASGDTHLPLDGVVLEAGDKVYFRLNKNDSYAYDAGVGFSVKLTYEEIGPAGAATEGTYGDPSLPRKGNVSWLHANAVEQPAGWEFQKVLLSDNSVSPMIWDAATNAWRAATDPASGDYYGAFSSGYWAGTAHAYDVMAVYTVPVKARVDIDVHVGQLNENSDGVILSVMRNELHRYLLEETPLTPASGDTHLPVTAVLEAGDKIYIRLNRNDTVAYDAGGAFSASVTYAAINPADDATGGTVTDPTLPRKDNVIWLHSNVKEQPDGWEFQKVLLSDNSTSPMTWDAATSAWRAATDPASGDYYGAFTAGYSAGTAHAYDVMAVYAVPVKAKFHLTLKLGPLNAGSDGVVVSVMRGTLNRFILEETLVVPADGEREIVISDIVAEAGDKIYIRLNKNDAYAYDAGGTFLASITYQEIDPAGSPSEGTVIDPSAPRRDNVNWLHTHVAEQAGSWEFRKVAVTDNSVSPMTWDAANSAWRASGDPQSADYYGFFSAGYSMGTADNYDVLAVFTAPVKARVNLDILVGQLDAQSDGVVVSVMRNTLNRLLLDDTHVTPADGDTDLSLTDIILDAGDKLFIRLGKYATHYYDAGGAFLASITYREINPAGDPTGGTVVDPALPRPGNTSWSHANVTAAPKDWSFSSVAADGSDMRALVWDPTGVYRVTADSASADYYGYFAANYSAGAARSRDVLAVYTAPAKVKIDLDIHLAGLAVQSNGVTLSAARNELNRMLLHNRVVLPADGEQHITAEGIVLEAGDNVYVRLGANGESAYDAGMSFSVRITYREINPAGNATQGTVMKLPEAGSREAVMQPGAVLQSAASIPETAGFNGFTHGYVTETGEFFPMVYDAASGMVRIPDARESDSYASFSQHNYSVGTADRYDTAIRFTAPAHLSVRLTLTAQVQNERSDGVNVKILRDTADNKIWPADSRHKLLTHADGMTSVRTELALGQGEEITFLLNKGGNYYYDQVLFFVTLEVLAVHDAAPEGAQTPPAGGTGLLPWPEDRDPAADIGFVQDGSGAGQESASPGTGVPLPLMALLPLGAAGAALLLSMKRRRHH